MNFPAGFLIGFPQDSHGLPTVKAHADGVTAVRVHKMLHCYHCWLIYTAIFDGVINQLTTGVTNHLVVDFGEDVLKIMENS